MPDCFLIPGKSTALDLAFTIHSDIGEAFIGAIDVKTKKKIGKELPTKNILDIAPTALKILGFDIPKDMEGNVIKLE